MRTAGQLLAAAANADRAQTGGLTGAQLVVLAVARQRIRAGQPVGDLQPGLAAAVTHPAAPLFDEMLSARLRRLRPWL